MTKTPDLRNGKYIKFFSLGLEKSLDSQGLVFLYHLGTLKELWTFETETGRKSRRDIFYFMLHNLFTAPSEMLLSGVITFDQFAALKFNFIKSKSLFTNPPSRTAKANLKDENLFQQNLKLWLHQSFSQI